jgi:hypothetical protein
MHYIQTERANGWDDVEVCTGFGWLTIVSSDELL